MERTTMVRGTAVGTAGKILRGLCLITAIANTGGNVALVAFWQRIFPLVGERPPADLYMFTAVCGFSFTSGVIAFLIWRDPPRAQGLLVAGIFAKGGFAA